MSPFCCQYLLDGLGSIVSTSDIQLLVSVCFILSSKCLSVQRSFYDTCYMVTSVSDLMLHLLKKFTRRCYNLHMAETKYSIMELRKQKCLLVTYFLAFNFVYFYITVFC